MPGPLLHSSILLPDASALAKLSEGERSSLIKHLKKVQKQQERERQVRQLHLVMAAPGAGNE
jgi:hypothetical protein